MIDEGGKKRKEIERNKFAAESGHPIFDKY